MGTELNTNNSDEMATPLAQQDGLTLRLLQRLPWLDAGTGALLAAISADLAEIHPEVIAAILFGSVARHEERPISHRRPSDIDLLALVDAGAGSASGDPLPLNTMLAIHHTIGEREYAHPVPALSVQAILAPFNLAGWDNLFISNVARDGVLLWARRPLPDALAPVMARGAIFIAE